MATVFNIQRFSVNDGPGIRTAVFFKGCPLNCLWCHNPESKSSAPELSFNPDKCVGCGNCLSLCPGQVHSASDGEHRIDRTKCRLCRACADYCAGALEVVGRDMTVEEVLKEVLRDLPFYRSSGGGLTVTGGEPMLQVPFLPELLKAAQEKGVSCCVETCGFAPWERFEMTLPYVDLFLYDVKETEPARHRADTGVDNALILDNLRRLDEAGARIVLRCPIIPGFNDREEHFYAISCLANSLNNVERVDVEPYHPLGKSKSLHIGREYPLPDLSFTAPETAEEWVRRIAADCRVPVALA